MLEEGLSAEEALKRAVSMDDGRASRQIGVIGLKGDGAQHTGDDTQPWAGHISGPNFVIQGNMLVGPQVLDAVAKSFEMTEGSHRYLADRLIEALSAGQARGGDKRKGKLQSAAVIVADPTPDRARRPDKITVNINVCEHPKPVEELRRIYNRVSETLGFRSLQQFVGRDVWQLKLSLHALGYYHSDLETLERSASSFLYSQDIIDAVESFREAEGLSTFDNGSPPGLVDAETIALLWKALERAGKAEEVRKQIKEITVIRR
jgi:uncharacterized Ntn-hydrolase superfamily protein